MAKEPLGTTRKTGEKCPESGVWKSLSTPSTTIPLSKGEKFPPYNNQGVTWKLTAYA
ncbi:YjzC family protein [Aquimarina agarilytica]|uniref:YjzC family protein n=1 Tax=Aquimarina agarilytica TaxID=1087449 RepID=UPI00028962F6|nr:YjzC family protein [Aquimarina agarilytica]